MSADCLGVCFVAGLAHGLAPTNAATIGRRAATACIRHIGGACGIPSRPQLADGL